ncbi:MAG: serine/threonine-protein kinase [Myxococcota bacterium]
MTAKYEHLLDLSAGGMGSVAIAVRRDGRFLRLYAIKHLLPALRDDDTAKAMFLEEGRLAGLLHHPNVVGVTDVGEDADGPYLVMDYVESISARDLIGHARKTGIPLAVSLICRIGAQVAQGLAAAHELTAHDGTPLRLVHRDVSPHNILLGFDGVTRLADFGIARAAGRDHRTSTGILKGKLGYMAPEMLQFREPTAQTDLFSLGVVLYELLTLSRLYGGRDDAERARRIVHEAPPDIGDERVDVPPELQALLLQLLAKDPALRPPSARLVAEALEVCAVDLATEEGSLDLANYLSMAFSEPRAKRRDQVQRALEAAPRREATRRPWPWILGAAVVLLVAGGAWALARPAQEVEEAPSDPVATEIRLHLTSTPDHAVVIANDTRIAPLRTPGEMTIPEGVTSLELRFEAEGYQTHRETIVPDQDGRVHVRLVPVAHAAETPMQADRPRRRRRTNKTRPAMRPTPPTEMTGFELFDG